MQNVFMAVAIDTYDSKSGYPGNIHPRYKQIVAERLATAGLRVAYGREELPANGPFPTGFTVNPGEEDGLQVVVVEYDTELTYDNTEISGFYYCCEEDVEACGFVANNFVEMEKRLVSQLDGRHIRLELERTMCPMGATPTGLAYLWRQTPVKGYLAAPIYAADRYRLPAAPWKARPGSDKSFIVL